MEIVTTERHYIQELKAIVEQFLTPLTVDPNSRQFLSSAQLQTIFVNVATLETLAQVRQSCQCSTFGFFDLFGFFDSFGSGLSCFVSSLTVSLAYSDC
jgi:hypothetical protein